jgi:hypothetical protein
MYLVREEFKAAIHNVVDLLWVELFGDGGIVSDISDECGDQFSFSFDRAAST